MICIVCKNQEAVDFKNIKQKRYWKCSYCEAIFLDKEFYLSSNDEYKHYLTHNNDVNDPRYKQFLSNLMLPLIERIKLNSIGLDYGCGPGPALSLMLREKGYQMFNYDPFFHSKKRNLLKKYDFICCTETVEHFHNPFGEFTRFNELLKSVIRIVCPPLHRVECDKDYDMGDKCDKDCLSSLTQGWVW